MYKIQNETYYVRQLCCGNYEFENSISLIIQICFMFLLFVLKIYHLRIQCFRNCAKYIFILVAGPGRSLTLALSKNIKNYTFFAALDLKSIVCYNFILNTTNLCFK